MGPSAPFSLYLILLFMDPLLTHAITGLTSMLISLLGAMLTRKIERNHLRKKGKLKD